MPEAIEDVGGRDAAPAEPGGAAERPLGQYDEVDAGLVVSASATGREEEGRFERDAKEVAPGRCVAIVGDARAVEEWGEAVAVEGGCREEGDEGTEATAENKRGSLEVIRGNDRDLHG